MTPWYLTTMALLASAIAAAAQDAPAPEPGRWAICAGVTDYSDFDIPSRAEGAAYSYLMAQRQTNPDLGAVPMEHCAVLSGVDARLETLKQALSVAAGAGPDDLVVVYVCLTTALLAGPDGSAVPVLCPHDAELKDLAKTSLSYDDLATAMAAIPAKHKVLFLDTSPWSAFKPEGVPEGLKAPDNVLDKLAASCTLVSAVSPGEALAETELARPLLGFCIAGAVQGTGDTNGDDQISLAELGQFIQGTAKRVFEGASAKQTPLIKGNLPPDVVFSAASPAEPKCPAGMKLVEGSVCVDIYEAPNVVGAMPTMNVNLFSAQGWCQQHGKRLCEPDEWEEACKGPDSWQFPYGDNPVKGPCNIGLYGAGQGQASRIGSFPYCVSGYGIYDMIGNVSEYIGTWGGADATADIRGGSFRDQRIDKFDCSTGGPRQPTNKGDYIGFRCCADPKGGGEGGGRSRGGRRNAR